MNPLIKTNHRPRFGYPFLWIGALLFLTVTPPVSTAASDPLESKSITLSDASLPEAGSKLSGGPTFETGGEEIFTWGWDVTFASQYLWRGIDYSDEKPVIQPEIFFNYRGFSTTLWSNYDTHEGVANEWDLYLQYTFDFPGISWSSGYAYFDYPNRPGWVSTQEVFMHLSLDIPLNPSLGVHYDFDAGQGFYESLAVSHAMDTPLGSLALEADLYFQNSYYDVTGIPSLEVKAGHGFSIQSFTITPSISYFFTWENEDFKESAAIPDTWLFTLNVARE